jgi:hypothetical protein
MTWWVGDEPLADAARRQLSPRAIDELQDWLFRTYLAKIQRAQHDHRCMDCGDLRREQSWPQGHRRCLKCQAYRRERIRKELAQLGGDLKVKIPA